MPAVGWRHPAVAASDPPAAGPASAVAVVGDKGLKQCVRRVKETYKLVGDVLTVAFGQLESL